MPDTASTGFFELSSTAAVPARLVEQARTDARAVGYAQGWAQGLHEAIESTSAERTAAQADQAVFVTRRDQRLTSAIQALHTAAAQVERTVATLDSEIEDAILAAAFEIAQALVGRELRDPQSRSTAALARVLKLVPATEPVTVWLNPADHEVLTAAGGTALIAAMDATAGRTINFESDPGLATGDAIGRSSSTTVDARLSDAVGRLTEYLAR